MAGRASHLVFRVTALETANLRGLIQVAGEANAIDARRPQLPRIPYVGRRRRFSVFRSGPVTGFAGFPVPTPLFIFSVHQMMGGLREGLRNIFVTNAASFRTNVG